MFLFNINVLFFKKQVKKKHKLLVKRCCNKMFCFVSLCFAKCEKLSLLGGSWGSKKRPLLGPDNDY